MIDWRRHLDTLGGAVLVGIGIAAGVALFGAFLFGIVALGGLIAGARP